MSRGLTFRSLTDMPEGMRKLAEQAEQAEQRKAGLQRALHQVERIAAIPQPIEKGDTRRSKYGNTKVTVDGIRFDSKREARYYERLKAEQAAGLVSYFLMQVPISLPGGTKYLVDFQVFMADGRVRYVDAKGRPTPEFQIKRREIEHHYPLVIELV